jgi:hypothetical protein
LVAKVLLLAIALYGGRVLLPILPPIFRVAGPPFLWAIHTYLAVFRVRRDLAAVIFSAAPAPAAGVAAHRLRRLKLRGLKHPLTVAASPFEHYTSGCRIRDRTIVRREILGTPRIENAIRSGRSRKSRPAFSRPGVWRVTFQNGDHDSDLRTHALLPKMGAIMCFRWRFAVMTLLGA